MLTELCQELRNWFVRDDADRHYGTFQISGGVITPSDFLSANMYYRIQGSLFNDGVHKVGDAQDTLVDETFNGTVSVMAVPKEIVSLSTEISTWKTQNDDHSPFASESFDGYSYSREVGGSWKKAFKAQLNKWRKI